MDSRLIVFDLEGYNTLKAANQLPANKYVLVKPSAEIPVWQLFFISTKDRKNEIITKELDSIEGLSEILRPGLRDLTDVSDAVNELFWRQNQTEQLRKASEELLDSEAVYHDGIDKFLTAVDATAKYPSELEKKKTEEFLKPYRECRENLFSHVKRGSSELMLTQIDEIMRSAAFQESVRAHAEVISQYDPCIAWFSGVLQGVFQNPVNADGTEIPAGSFLIMPVQRMPRYYLLLKEITKYTSAFEHQKKEWEVLSKSLEERRQMIGDVTAATDIKMKQAQQDSKNTRNLRVISRIAKSLIPPESQELKLKSPEAVKRYQQFYNEMNLAMSELRHSALEVKTEDAARAFRKAFLSAYQEASLISKNDSSLLLELRKFIRKADGALAKVQTGGKKETWDGILFDRTQPYTSSKSDSDLDKAVFAAIKQDSEARQDPETLLASPQVAMRESKLGEYEDKPSAAGTGLILQLSGRVADALAQCEQDQPAKTVQSAVFRERFSRFMNETYTTLCKLSWTHPSQLRVGKVGMEFRESVLHAYIDASLFRQSEPSLLPLLRRFVRNTDGAIAELAVSEKSPMVSGVVFDFMKPPALPGYSPHWDDSALDEAVFASMHANSRVMNKFVEYIFDRANSVIELESRSPKAEHANHFKNAVDMIIKIGPNAIEHWNQLSAHHKRETAIDARSPENQDKLKTSFAQIASKPDMQASLEMLYEQVVKARLNTGYPGREMPAYAKHALEGPDFNQYLRPEGQKALWPKDSEAMRARCKEVLVQLYMSAYIDDRQKNKFSMTVKGPYLQAMEAYVLAIEKDLLAKGQKGLFVNDQAGLKNLSEDHLAEFIFQNHINKDGNLLALSLRHLCHHLEQAYQTADQEMKTQSDEFFKKMKEKNKCNTKLMGLRGDDSLRTTNYPEYKAQKTQWEQQLQKIEVELAQIDAAKKAITKKVSNVLANGYKTLGRMEGPEGRQVKQRWEELTQASPYRDYFERDKKVFQSEREVRGMSAQEQMKEPAVRMVLSKGGGYWSSPQYGHSDHQAKPKTEAKEPDRSLPSLGRRSSGH